MNPNRHRAVEIRRRAIIDQIEGLERMVADGPHQVHLARRLEHTLAELDRIGIHPAEQRRQNTAPRENPREAGPRGF